MPLSFYLLQHRQNWIRKVSVGKIVVTTQLIDRIAAKLGRKIDDVPVWIQMVRHCFLDSWLCFGGEESTNITFSRLNGSVLPKDKDGFVPAILAAEITAK